MYCYKSHHLHNLHAHRCRGSRHRNRRRYHNHSHRHHLDDLHHHHRRRHLCHDIHITTILIISARSFIHCYCHHCVFTVTINEISIDLFTFQTYHILNTLNMYLCVIRVTRCGDHRVFHTTFSQQQPSIRQSDRQLPSTQ